MDWRCFAPNGTSSGVILGILLGCASLASAQESKSDPAAARIYAVALGFQNQRLFEQAIPRWQKFIADYPRDPHVTSARHNLGVCQLQGKQFPEAAATFREVLKDETFTSADAALFNLGLALYHLGLKNNKPEELRDAANNFAQVPARYPKSKQAPSALYYQGESLYAAGDLVKAVDAYNKLIADYPSDPLLANATYALGTTQQQLDRHADAVKTFRAFLMKWAKDDRVNECRLRIGRCLFLQKDFKEAEKIFKEVAAVPNYELADYAWMQHAECVRSQNKHAEAAALFEGLPKKFAKSRYTFPAHLEAGKCWFEAEKLAEAERALQLAAQSRSDSAAEASYWLGRTQLRAKKAPQAVTTLETAIQAHAQSPLLPQLMFLRVEAIANIPDRRKEAIALYEAFAKNHAGHELGPRAHYQAARVALDVTDYPTARRLAEAFFANPRFANDPLAPSVLFLHGEAFLHDDPPEPDKAEALYRRVWASHPMHAIAGRAKLRTGFCRYLAKDYNACRQILTELFGQANADKPLQAEGQWLIGRCWHDEGKPTEAVAAFQKSLTVLPNWERADEVRLALAASYRGLTRPSEASAELKRLLSDFPTSSLRPQAWHQLGEIALDQKNLDEAKNNFEQVVSKHPESDMVPLAQYGLGTIAFAKNQNAETVKVLGELLNGTKGGETADRARYLRGLAHQRLGMFDQAVRDLTDYLKTEPTGESAFHGRYTLGLALVGLKQYEQAAGTFDVLVKASPDHPRAPNVLYEKAFALQSGGKDEDAAAAFEQLATRFPTNPLAPESWFRVGEFHEKGNRPEKATTAYESSAKHATQPELQEKALYKLGWVLYQQKEHARAAAAFGEQLAKHGKGTLAADGAYLAGESFYKVNQPAKAIPYFERVLGSSDRKYHARSLYRLGDCQGQLGEWAKSQQTFTQLINQFSDFKLIHEARYGLGFALQNQEKFDEACKEYEAITRAVNTETAAKSRFGIGECAFAREKYKEAIEHFLEAALGYPYPEYQALGHYEAARCFIQLKDAERARENLRKVVEKHPDHPRSKDAARLLANLDNP